MPTDGVGFDLEATAIMRGTRNLEAAKRLADFTVSRTAAELYGRFYAMLALPGVEPTVRGYPAEFAQRLVNANFAEIAAARERLPPSTRAAKQRTSSSAPAAMRRVR